MQYGEPKCHGCQYFIADSDHIGGTGQCSAYKNGCPRQVYYERANCPRYSEQPKRKTKTSASKKTTPRKTKKG